MSLNYGHVKCLMAQPKDLVLLLEMPYTALEKLVYILQNSEFMFNSENLEEKATAEWLQETLFPNLQNLVEEFKEDSSDAR